MPVSTNPDVFIIGAGIAGATFARILCDAGLDVTMVDAGGQHSLRPGANLKNFHNYQIDVDQFGALVRGLMHVVSVPPIAGRNYTRNALNPRQNPDTNLDGAVVAYCVGGMAVHWTCAIPRQDPEIERPRFLSDEEWDSLYGEAETLLKRRTDLKEKSLRQRVLREFLREKKYQVENTPLAAEPMKAYTHYTGADTVLGQYGDPGGSGRLTLHEEHRVSRLNYKSGRIDSATVRDMRTGEEREVHSGVFIVASGWLHSAQILWNSGIQRDESSALGRYLMDHTFTACQVVLGDEVLDRMREQARQQQLAVEEADQADVPIPKDDPAPHLYIPISQQRPWHSMIFREAFQFDPKAPPVDSRLIVDLKWFGMIEPREDNRVTFEPDIVDRYDMPQPTFHFRLGDEDRRRQDAMMEHMKEVAASLGTLLPKADGSPGEAIVVPLGASTHTMGATRMGEDSGSSVVDLNSKVHGFDNLFVGGNCVLPTANASNPTLTSLALAVRAAHHIAENFPSRG